VQAPDNKEGQDDKDAGRIRGLQIGAERVGVLAEDGGNCTDDRLREQRKDAEERRDEERPILLKEALKEPKKVAVVRIEEREDREVLRGGEKEAAERPDKPMLSRSFPQEAKRLRVATLERVTKDFALTEQFQWWKVINGQRLGLSDKCKRTRPEARADVALKEYREPAGNDSEVGQIEIHRRIGEKRLQQRHLARVRRRGVEDHRNENANCMMGLCGKSADDDRGEPEKMAEFGIVKRDGFGVEDGGVENEAGGRDRGAGQ
jgi:hypothetical protein